MIMEKRKGGMRLSEYANNSSSWSQNKQHEELNDEKKKQPVLVS
jgi:hypothetical protein